MHREWLGDLYAWAGQYRTVEMEKDGFRWPPAHLVPQNMTHLERGCAQHTPCRPAPLAVVARRMAEVHAELLLVHPFREGNGRLARWLADLMALQAGLPLPDYRFRGRGSGHERAVYLAAVKQGYLTRYDNLTAFFLRALSRGAAGGSASRGFSPARPLKSRGVQRVAFQHSAAAFRGRAGRGSFPKARPCRAFSVSATGRKKQRFPVLAYTSIVPQS